MKLLKIGNTIIDLDCVVEIDLDYHVEPQSTHRGYNHAVRLDRSMEPYDCWIFEGAEADALRAYFAQNSVDVMAAPKTLQETSDRMGPFRSMTISHKAPPMPPLENQSASLTVTMSYDDLESIQGFLAEAADYFARLDYNGLNRDAMNWYEKISEALAVPPKTATPNQTEAFGYRDTLSMIIMRLQEIQADTVGNISQNSAEWLEEAIKDLGRILRANEAAA